MNVKLKALSIKSMDYGDNGKLVTLITRERGKITAKAIGCKSIKSPLHIASSPFCFGEYIFNEKNGKLSLSGCDVEKFYGEMVTDVSGKTVNPNFISIAVSNDGIISVLEENSKKIYQYSQDGTMLNVFGGEGEVLGYFTTPVSIASDSQGSIYVADSSQNSIIKFKRTSFASSVYAAQSAYDKGLYEEAYKLFSDASSLNPNYSVLNKGIAKCLYKLDKIEEAAEAYNIADDRSGYGNMMYEIRNNFIKNNFEWICLGIALTIAVAIIVIRVLKKYSDKLIVRYYHLDE